MTFAKASNLAASFFWASFHLLSSSVGESSGNCESKTEVKGEPRASKGNLTL